MKLTGLCGWSWATLGASAEVLARFGGLCGRYRAALRPLWAVLAVLGASVGGPGQLLEPKWRSRIALGTYVSGVGPLLRPLRAVLGRSWGLCWLFWAILGTYVGGLGRSLGLCGRSWAALGRPNLSGSEPGTPATLTTLRDQYPFFL